MHKHEWVFDHVEEVKKPSATTIYPELIWHYTCVCGAKGWQNSYDILDGSDYSIHEGEVEK